MNPLEPPLYMEEAEVELPRGYIFFLFYFYYFIDLDDSAVPLSNKLTNKKRMFPVHQKSKTRRAEFTIHAVQRINEWYGSISNFLKCLDELKDFTISKPPMDID